MVLGSKATLWYPSLPPPARPLCSRMVYDARSYVVGTTWSDAGRGGDFGEALPHDLRLQHRKGGLGFWHTRPF